MCGIAGAYQQVDGAGTARAMGARLAHRGPDDSGEYAFTDDRVSVHLHHRRLSIIDRRGGAQPFVKQGLALTYNGELYNYRELRAELSAAGARFVTSSDTEVVLEAWRYWGPACLHRFRGMFAFAVFDEATGHLFLARDHFGIKPLFYMLRKDGVVFASELKALVEVYGEELSIDASALVASILYYWVPEGRCCISEVIKLRPGSWMDFRPDGFLSERRYWDVSGEAAEAAAGPPYDLGDVVEDSVAAHLVADVPVSTFLSGGLDSSIVTVLAQRTIPEIDAYTIRFRAADQRLEAMPDDARYARKLADRFGIDLHEIEIAPDVAQLLPRMVDILDEPIGDPAAINTLLICEAARDAGSKVQLSGMGADEFFGGYRKHLACLMAARYQRTPAVGRRAIGSVLSSLPVAAAGRGFRYARWAKRFLTFSELAEEEAFRRSYTLYDPAELASLLDPELTSMVGDVIEEHREIYMDNRLPDHVSRMCLADSRLFLAGLNLAYTDRASMAASTEVRVPFVDPMVFRAAFSLPGREKVRGRDTKVALRKAATRWLPDEIISRPKASFSAPLRAWVSHDLKDLVHDALLGGDLIGSGFLNAGAVEELVHEDRTGREDRSKQIWQLLTLELWHRRVRNCGVSA